MSDFRSTIQKWEAKAASLRAQADELDRFVAMLREEERLGLTESAKQKTSGAELHRQILGELTNQVTFPSAVRGAVKRLSEAGSTISTPAVWEALEPHHQAMNEARARIAKILAEMREAGSLEQLKESRGPHPAEFRWLSMA